MKQTLFIAMLLIASPAMAVEIKAPLGLQWGQTQAEIKKLGVEFTKCGNKVYDYVECIITNPPTPLSWATNYDLTFLNGKLHNVGIVGEIKNDWTRWEIHQLEIQILFEKIKATLTTKYGKPAIDITNVKGSIADWEYDGYIEFAAYPSKEDNTHFVIMDYRSKHFVDTEKQREAKKDENDIDGL